MCEKLFVDYFWCVCLLFFLKIVPFPFFQWFNTPDSCFLTRVYLTYLKV